VDCEAVALWPFAKGVGGVCGGVPEDEVFFLLAAFLAAPGYAAFAFFYSFLLLVFYFSDIPLSRIISCPCLAHLSFVYEYTDG
jgi:hypothetical protein